MRTSCDSSSSSKNHSLTVDILPFTGDNLALALSNKYTKAEAIKLKHQFDYLQGYLGAQGLNAMSIVMEEKYISKDFLHDYAAYYAFCFEEYSKVCRRVHFFKTTITEDLINRLILDNGDIPESFWDNYLGFIVVKPLPTTVIGYTILKNYNSSNPRDDRYFWGLREYKMHVFGHEIKFESLAFQEQDSVLAACATTAIWCMLNKAAMNTHTILKSPSEITKDAGNTSSDGSRLFPNSGLSVEQICQAIYNSGLVTDLKQPDIQIPNPNGGLIECVSNQYTKKILNAYRPLGTPIILVVNVPLENDFGYHAIAVSGFNQGPVSPVARTPEISWVSDNINRIYAHDDQHGPFVRIDLQNEGDLKTPWTDLHAQNWPTTVNQIVIPLFPKVRIAYEDIEAVVHGLDRILSLFFDSRNLYDLVWDIKIDFSENFKSGLKIAALDDGLIIQKLTSSYPKYIWIATCYIGTHKILEFLFDATGLNNGMIAIDLIFYMPDTERKVLHDFLLANNLIVKALFQKKARLHYYDFLIKELTG